MIDLVRALRQCWQPRPCAIGIKKVKLFQASVSLALKDSSSRPFSIAKNIRVRIIVRVRTLIHSNSC